VFSQLLAPRAVVANNRAEVVERSVFAQWLEGLYLVLATFREDSYLVSGMTWLGFL
jgi:hypothetical protein